MVLQVYNFVAGLSVSAECLENVWNMSVGCLEGVWRASEGFLKSVWRVGGYLKGFYRMYKWYLGECLDSIWKASQHWLGLNRTGQVSTSQVRTGQVKTGLFRTGQLGIGLVETSQVKLEEFKLGWVKSSPVKLGHVKNTNMFPILDFFCSAKMFFGPKIFGDQKSFHTNLFPF